MAEVLTVVAEEMGRVFGLVWSGVGVAMRLNNQVMNTFFKVTTRIVQLLLLLTHKVLGKIYAKVMTKIWVLVHFPSKGKSSLIIAFPSCGKATSALKNTSFSLQLTRVEGIV
ncbi:hypothetical protein E2C01_056020 [Portunus trituberculatus]|uniref:Uncharacterized protein n=1 Tax=Portunus trituberculatus TaxID=210409 RepID=A0A5B7GSZ0_PORTR|nr:hypothetical protein [Portunus trituberculatus]